jgi:hypothetical protein
MPCARSFKGTAGTPGGVPSRVRHDPLEGVSGGIDFVVGVVQGKAEPAARGWIEAQVVMGERCAVTAGARFDVGTIERVGDRNRVPPRNIESNQR